MVNCVSYKVALEPPASKRRHRYVSELWNVYEPIHHEVMALNVKANNNSRRIARVDADIELFEAAAVDFFQEIFDNSFESMVFTLCKLCEEPGPGKKATLSLRRLRGTAKACAVSVSEDGLASLDRLAELIIPLVDHKKTGLLLNALDPTKGPLNLSQIKHGRIAECIKLVNEYMNKIELLVGDVSTPYAASKTPDCGDAVLDMLENSIRYRVLEMRTKSRRSRSSGLSV